MKDNLNLQLANAAEVLLQGKREHERIMPNVTVSDLVTRGRRIYAKFLQGVDEERAFEIAVSEMANLLNPEDRHESSGQNFPPTRLTSAPKHKRLIADRDDVKRKPGRKGTPNS